MALAQATVVLRVRQLLGDNPWATTASAASSSSTIAVPDGTRWDEGAIVEFSAGGEQAWVSSVSGNNLTAIRGYNGTTAATQASQTVWRDPAFTYKAITDAVDMTIQELWPYAYKKSTVAITPNTSSPYRWYNLATDFMELIAVTQVNTGSTPNSVYTYGTRGSGLPITLNRTLPVTLVASGIGIAFQSFASTAYDISVDYAAKLTPTLSSTNYTDLDDGILADIVSYGAAARLVVASDVPRATQEDIAMGDSTVQVGMRSSVGRQLYQQYLFLRNQYREELMRKWPLVGKGAGGYPNRGIRGIGAPYP